MKALVGGSATLGEGLELVEDAVVLIEDHRIVAAGPGHAVGVPAEAEPVDVSGLTLRPGAIDAHVHIGFADPHDVVAGGVTTARDLGWPPGRIWPILSASDEPFFDGPAVVAAGPMLTVTGGYPTRAAWAPPGTGMVVDGAEHARAVVDDLVASGACVVKVALNRHVGPTLDGATLAAITRRAHERGLRVTGHVNGIEELEKALETGVDELAHMLMGLDEIPASLLGRMVTAGMAVVPTLAIRAGHELDVAVQNLRRFRDAGGTVVYGTDLGNAGPRPGIDPMEVDAMAAAGMSARDVLLSSTVDSARWLGLDRKGRLAPGMDADIVAGTGDPTESVAAVVDVRRVWRMGREIARAS